MENLICVESGVKGTQTYRVGGGLCISLAGFKAIWDSSDGGKDAKC